MDRYIEMVVRNGVPLPILIGIEAQVTDIARRTAKPTTSQVLAVTYAAPNMGIRARLRQQVV